MIQNCWRTIRRSLKMKLIITGVVTYINWDEHVLEVIKSHPNLQFKVSAPTL